VLERRGRDSEQAADLGAVDEERLLELVLHLEQLANGGVGQGYDAQQQGMDPEEPGVGVRLVGVAEHAGGDVGQGSGKCPVAEVRLGTAAWAEVVRRAIDGHLDLPAPMRGQQVRRHGGA
jgi:hypothetical protein